MLTVTGLPMGSSSRLRHRGRTSARVRPRAEWQSSRMAGAADGPTGRAAAEPRLGEDGRTCPPCEVVEAQVVWEDEHWQLVHRGAPSGLPVVLFLNTREHLDHGRLPDDLASEHGRILNRLVRIVESLDGVERCHVHRFGDGCAHAHVWVVGRPSGQPLLRGARAVEADDELPPVPEERWLAHLRTVGTKLATWGGRAGSPERLPGDR